MPQHPLASRIRFDTPSVSPPTTGTPRDTPVAGIDAPPTVPHVGTLTVITGPMYSGKSSGLLDRVERVARACRRVVILRPATDTRTTSLQSHAGRALSPAHAAYVTEARVSVKAPAHRDAEAGVGWPRIPAATRLVALDEVQFLPTDAVVAFALDVTARGIDVVAAGLDTDSRGVPFATVASLLAVADAVDKRAAVCVSCGSDARRSQRLTAARGRVVVGGSGDYEARCRGCWVPDAGEE